MQRVAFNARCAQLAEIDSRRNSPFYRRWRTSFSCVDRLDYIMRLRTYRRGGFNNYDTLFPRTQLEKRKRSLATPACFLVARSRALSLYTRPITPFIFFSGIVSKFSAPRKEKKGRFSPASCILGNVFIPPSKKFLPGVSLLKNFGREKERESTRTRDRGETVLRV